jgi:hypothetical protein
MLDDAYFKLVGRTHRKGYRAIKLRIHLRGDWQRFRHGKTIEARFAELRGRAVFRRNQAGMGQVPVSVELFALLILSQFIVQSYGH